MSVDMTTQSIAVADNWVKVGSDFVGDKPNGAISGGNAALGWSAPSGIVQGSSVSLTTDGTNPFGTGPTNVRYENFESFTAGTRMTSSAAFDAVSSFWPAPIENDISRSGSNSAKFTTTKTSDGTVAASANTVTFVGGATEAFVSYAVKIPTGAYFPGTTAGNSGTNADYDDSSWKAAWLLGVNEGSGFGNDLVIPSHVGSGIWKLGGNNLGNLLETGGANPTWWKWNKWNRFTTWVKAGAIPQTDSGNLYFQVANGEEALTEFNNTPVIFGDPDAVSPYQWEQININGWIRPDVGGSDGSGAGIDTRYDDIYVSWGTNAAARVELGDNAVYTSCTNLHIQYVTPADWATGQLDFDIDYGPFNPSDELWWHITLEDNITRYSVRAN